MKQISLSKNKIYLKDSFLEMVPHSNYYAIGHNYEVYEYGTDKFIKVANLVEKKTILLSDLSNWDAIHYNDSNKEIVQKIWKNRMGDRVDFMLFDLLLFSTYAANNKFLDTAKDVELFKDLVCPVKIR